LTDTSVCTRAFTFAVCPLADGSELVGARKAALDRITLATARELEHLGVTANAINPGPVDTGWMTDDLRQSVLRHTPLGRLGTPQDTAHLAG
jgi:3-oxoacyl-[acyl-carrier protein] reductase